MNKEETHNIMRKSRKHRVRITDVNNKVVEGTVMVFESRFDNSDDDDFPGEASIIVWGDDGLNYLLCESDIKKIVLDSMTD